MVCKMKKDLWMETKCSTLTEPLASVRHWYSRVMDCVPYERWDCCNYFHRSLIVRGRFQTRCQREQIMYSDCLILVCDG